MELNEKLKLVEESKQFVEWKTSNENSYLAHIFRMFDEVNKNTWQFGYYNPDDTITTFILDDNEVKEVPEQEIFKEDKRKLGILDLNKVKIDFEAALKIAEELRIKKYKEHPVLKSFAILQVLEEQVYNITFVTQTFNTLNIHVSSASSKIIKEKITALLELGKFEKGKVDYIG